MPGRLTIGIDASRANARQRTGTEWYAYHVIRELRDIIPDTYRVILYSKEALRDGLEDLPSHWESRVLAWPPRKLWTQLRLSWEMYRRPPDMLFVPAHALPVILPRKAVTTLHDVAFMAYPQAYRPLERIYHRFAARFAVRRARILTVSEFSRREIVRYFRADEAGIRVTPLGIDTDTYRRPSAEVIRDCLDRHGIRPPYFLFVGRLEAKKNIDGLVSAFQRIVEARGNDAVRLVLVGKRGYGCEAALRQASGLPVLELGYVAPEEMAALYAGATALALPSWYEGFGLPVLEAFMSGVPAVVSRTASLPEVGGSAVGYVDPASPEDIAAALGRLLDDRGLRQRLAAGGTERVRLFSWRRTAEMTWEAIRAETGPVTMPTGPGRDHDRG